MRRGLTSGVLVIVMLAAMGAVGRPRISRRPQHPTGKPGPGPGGLPAHQGRAQGVEAITSEAQAKRFIELFWARRNPNPEQPVNTFRAQIDAIVRYADANFRTRASGAR